VSTTATALTNAGRNRIPIICVSKMSASRSNQQAHGAQNAASVLKTDSGCENPLLISTLIPIFPVWVYMISLELLQVARRVEAHVGTNRGPHFEHRQFEPHSAVLLLAADFSFDCGRCFSSARYFARSSRGACSAILEVVSTPVTRYENGQGRNRSCTVLADYFRLWISSFLRHWVFRHSSLHWV